VSIDVWAELAIAKDSDRDTIRRAYASRLRTINSEDDAEAFQRLRAAYEQALRSTAQPQPQPPSPQNPPTILTTARQPVVGDTLVDPQVEERARLRRGFEGLASLLLTRLKSPDPANRDTAASVLERLLASPALDDLTLTASTELWVAHQIVAHVPQSDPLIPIAAAHFGWNRGGYRVAFPAVGAVLRRCEELAFVQAVAQPSHALHRGWKALTRPAKQPWRRRLDAFRPVVQDSVRTMLVRMKERPGLRLQANAEALSWWEDYTSKPQVEQSLVFAPFCVIAACALLTGIAGRPLPRPLHIFLAFPLGICAALLYGALARRWLVARVATVAERSRSLTGIAAFALLPFAAMAMPQSAIGLIESAVLGIVIATFVDIAMPVRGDTSIAALRLDRGWAGQLALFCIAIVFTSAMPTEKLASWIVVLAAIAVGWWRATPRLAAFMYLFAARKRRQLVIGLVGAGWLLAVLLFVLQATPDPFPPGLGL
jgi:hypothetical protein